MKRVIPLTEPELSDKEVKYLQKSIKDGWVSSAGPLVEKFEKKLLSFCNRKYAIATVNGTSALFIGIKSLNLPKGSLVVIPDWTFAATANAIIHAGLKPIFLDIKKQDWCINEDYVEKCLKKYKSKVSAILFVNALGNIPNINKLKKLSKRFSLALIEDAAGSIGSKKGNCLAGSNGDFSIFSFNGNKTLTSGGGGAILTDNFELATKVRYLISQARDTNGYYYGDIGYNLKMPNINAALGLAQAEKLNSMIKKKQAIAYNYFCELKNIKHFTFMPIHSFKEHSCWISCILFKQEEKLISLSKHLRKKNISVSPFWNSLSIQNPYRKYIKMPTLVSESFTNRVLALPSSSNLTKKDQKIIITEILNWYLQAL